MKRLALLVVLMLSALGARAQNTIAVSGSNVQDAGGRLLVSGSICFQGTDSNNKPISFQQGGGGSVITSPYCSPVNNGVITTFNVANPANTSPANIKYHIQVKQGSRIVLDAPLSWLCAQSVNCNSLYTFNFDNCFSTGVCLYGPQPIPFTTVPGAAGANGAAGPPINYQGTWSSVVTYTIGQAVLYTTDGYFYVSLTNGNLNNTPALGSTNWQRIASLPTDNTWTTNNRFKGPIPFVDLSTYTRPINTNGCSTTATINIGTPTTATLASGACFQVENGFNDGITIWGAGPTITITSPAAPTVTPNTISSGGINLGGGNYTPNTVVNGAAGSSTYSYIIVAFDQFGGYAAPSAATTITTGPATLGFISCTISTETRSGSNVTKNYTASCPGAVVGALSFDTGVQPNPAGTFGGYYNTQTVNSATQVVYAGPYNSTSFGWNSTDNGNLGSNSSSGGTSYYLVSNHLRWTYGTNVWRYGICAERPGDGSYHRIGMTRPSTSVNKDIQFDDYGATMMASFQFPPYFTDAVCNGVTGQNDPLTTTITAGAGTTTVTLANAASNGVTAATALYDNGPGVVAAATSVSSNPHGELFIPPTAFTFGYLINSFTVMPGVKIRQAGELAANEPIQLSGGVNWSGDASSSCGPTAFEYFTVGAACVLMQNASPVFYIAGDYVWLQNLSFITTGSGNWGTFIVDDAPHSRFSNIGLSPDGGTSTDFLSTPLVLRGGNGSADCQYDLDHIGFGMAGFSSTPGSWNAGIFIPSAQTGTGTLTNGGCIINMDKVSMGLHGTVQEGGGVDWNISNIDRQGGVMPWLWHLNGSGTSPENISFSTISLDTDGGGLLSLGNNTGVRFVDNVHAYDVKASGATTFGGFGPSSIDMSYSTTTPAPNANGGFVRQCGVTGPSNNITLNCNFDYSANIGPLAKVYFPLPAPTNLTLTAVSGGTNNPNITVQFVVVANDITGNYTMGSLASNTATTSGTCTGSGNCQFQLSWTPVIGAANYTVLGCQVSGSPLALFNCPTYTNIPSATNITTNPVTMNSLGGGNGLSNISLTLAGQSGMNGTYTWSTYLRSNPQVFSGLPSCTSSTVGLEATVTDSTTTTWGATITGSGANTVLAFCDGAHWTVYGM